MCITVMAACELSLMKITRVRLSHKHVDLVAVRHTHVGQRNHALDVKHFRGLVLNSRWTVDVSSLRACRTYPAARSSYITPRRCGLSLPVL